MPIFNRKIHTYIFTLVAVMLFITATAAILLGSYYTWPDLECIHESRAKYVGFATAWTQLMVSMDGRYATNFLHGINPLVWAPMQLYKLMPLLGMALFTGALWFFFSAILATARQALILALLFVALHFAVSPGLAFELFSMVFSLMYLWGVSIWLIWVGASIRFLILPLSFKKNVWLAVAIFFLFFSYGINEMFLVANSISMMALALIAYRNNKLLLVLPLCMVAVLSVGFFFFLSGSMQRVAFEAGFHQNNHLLNEGQWFVKHLAQAWYLLMSGGGAIWLLLIPALSAFRFKDVVVHFLHYRNNGKIIIFHLLAISILAAIPFYVFVGSKTFFPSRIFNTCFSFLQLLIVLAAIMYLAAIFKRVAKWRMFSVAAIMMMCFQFFYHHNNYKIIIDEWQSGAYHLFDQQFKSMHFILQEAATVPKPYKTAIIDAVPYKNLIIYTPSTFWQGNVWNKAVLEGFYGLDEVFILNDTLNKRLLVNNILCKP